MGTLEEYIEAKRSGALGPVVKAEGESKGWWPWILAALSAILGIAALCGGVYLLYLWYEDWQSASDTHKPAVVAAKPKPALKVTPKPKVVRRAPVKPKPAPKPAPKVVRNDTELDDKIDNIAWMQQVCNKARQKGLECYPVGYNNRGQLVYSKPNL